MAKRKLKRITIKVGTRVLADSRNMLDRKVIKSLADQIADLMDRNMEVIVVSSGAIGVPGELNGVSAVADGPGDILKQPKRLRQARILGENVLNICKNARANL